MDSFTDYLLSTAPLSVLILLGVVVMLWRHHEKEETRWIGLLGRFTTNMDGLSEALATLGEQVAKMAVSLDIVSRQLEALEDEARHSSDAAARHEGAVSTDQETQDKRIDALERGARDLDANGG